MCKATVLEEVYVAAAEKYRYEPETGKFFFVKAQYKSQVGKEAGSIDAYGYVSITLRINRKHKILKAHRLAWFITFGTLTEGLVINHINHNRSDNRIANLEEVTNRENGNLKHLPSTSRYVGVSWNKQRDKWQAFIWAEGKSRYIGLYESEFEASLAYWAALDKHNNKFQES